MVNQETARMLCGKGHDVSLLGPNSAFTSGYRSRQMAPRRCNVYRFGPRLSRLPGFTIGFMILVLKAIPLALKAHVILCEHHKSHMAAFCAAVTAKVTRRPLVVRVHDLLYQEPRTVVGFAQWLVNLILKWPAFWSFRRARCVLVPGDELVRVCQRMYGLQSETVDVSYNGVDTNKFSRRYRSKNLRRNIGSRHIVIFSGAISLRRGLDTLLRAVPLIRSNLPDLKVVIAGHLTSPEIAMRLRRLARDLEIGDCIEFIQVNPDVVPQYAASADVGIGELRIRPSNYGSTPLKVVEYMASGCIVVAGRGTLSSHLIRDGFNGILATPDDPDSVAKKILSVFSDPRLARKIRIRAHRTVARTFSWDVIATKLEIKLQAIARTNN